MGPWEWGTDYALPRLFVAEEEDVGANRSFANTGDLGIRKRSGQRLVGLLMNPVDTISNRSLSPKQSEDGGEPADGLCALLHQFEASLTRSREALVTLDLAGIHRGTREQISLCRELEAQIQREKHPGAGFGNASSKATRPEELDLAGNAVLQALRLQSALLARAQRKLHVLRNSLAGPAMSYASLFDPSSRPQAAPFAKQQEWI